MKRPNSLIIPTLFCLNFTCFCQSPQENSGRVADSREVPGFRETNRQWPSYRGYLAAGTMDNMHLPDSFNVESGYNIKWIREVPGMGLSCPVIWDNRVFITTAISEEDTIGYKTGFYGNVEPVDDSSLHSWKVLCIERNSGEIRWERTAFQGIPQVKRHPKSSHANTTVATDGTHVIAFFGSEGLYCYNMEGKLLWKRDFGLIRSAWNVVESAEWEFCSSPVIFGEVVIIQADALNKAFVSALDVKTGETIWRKERDEISTWCTPTVYNDGKRPIIAVNGYRHRGGYDLETGEEVWKMAGGGDIPIPTPVAWKDLIFFNSAHGRHAPLMAIRTGAKGQIPYPEDNRFPPEVAWFHDRGGAYMGTVLVYDSLLYQLQWNGTLSCYEPGNGELIYRETVHPSSFIASPIASDNRIYMVSEDGILYIAKAGRKYELLNSIPLGEVSLVTPAVAGNMLYLRTEGRLIAVSATK